MILNQKFSIKFWLNSQRAKNDLAPIYIQISLDGNRSNISTSYFVDAKNWNKKVMRLTTTDDQSKLINSELGKTFNELEQIYTKALINEEPITAADIKDRFLGADSIPQEKEKSILDIFEYHNLKMEEQLKIGKIASKTYIRYVITKKKIEAFMKYQYNGQNTGSICIEHFGDFDMDEMSEEQIQGALTLTAALCLKFNLAPSIKTIIYHHWYDLTTGKYNLKSKNRKTCPGTNFFGGNQPGACRSRLIPLIYTEIQKIMNNKH